MILIVPLVSRESNKLEVDLLFINSINKMQSLLRKIRDSLASWNLSGLLSEDQYLKKGKGAHIVT